MPKGVDVEHMNDFPIPAQDISTAAYSGSDLIKEVCWFVDNSREKKPMQAQKRANAFGLYDMSGNVCEWVWDSWELDGYTREKPVDPVIHQNTPWRTYRSGGFSSDSWNARASFRAMLDAYYRFPSHGFRCAKNIGQEDGQKEGDEYAL